MLLFKNANWIIVLCIQHCQNKLYVAQVRCFALMNLLCLGSWFMDPHSCLSSYEVRHLLLLCCAKNLLVWYLFLWCFETDAHLTLIHWLLLLFFIVVVVIVIGELAIGWPNICVAVAHISERGRGFYSPIFCSFLLFSTIIYMIDEYCGIVMRKSPCWVHKTPFVRFRSYKSNVLFPLDC